ncbi:MAG TPA: hypothetical protein VNK44_08900 [Candidatus Nitrosotenuis sp.]|nr:hypothetical protein [Candidatus Nitrosotenuis sp.]
MPLDVIQEKNLNEIINYALEYPSVVLSATKSSLQRNTADFAYGLYVGYISGLFFDKFLLENKRFLNDDELSDFYSRLAARRDEIMLKIKTHLRLA